MSSQSTASQNTARGAFSNAGWNAFATLWNIGISFLLTPLLIRYLGTSDYGLLLLVWSVTGLLGITNLGVGEATLRYVSHYLADRDMDGVNRVFGSTLAFYIVVCVVVSAVLVPATSSAVRWINVPPEGLDEAGALLRFAAALFSVGMVTNAFRSVPMALHRYDISSKVGFIQGSVRTIGFAILVVAGFDVIAVIAWDLAVAIGVLGVYIVLARRLLPAVRLVPRVSGPGMREIFGYGVYSFFTQIFLSAYRESGKLILGNHVGPTGVAYLGTPDSIAYRLYMVVVSGIETLMPRFSAARDPEAARVLLVRATQVALTIAVVLFVPLAVLMPDLLRLWIDPEFATHSATAGQLLALSFVAPAGFAPIATFYRGVGRPGFVTVVLVLAGLIVLGSSIALVPTQGPTGVGYGYLLSSVPWIAGLCWGWLELLGVRSITQLFRAVVTPLLLAIVALLIQIAVRSRVGEPGWFGLFGLGGAFSVLTGVLCVSVDRMFRGESLSSLLIEHVSTSAQLQAIRKRVHLWHAR